MLTLNIITDGKEIYGNIQIVNEAQYLLLERMRKVCKNTSINL